MPAYQQAEYIREAIDSVLAQTYSDWELIIVDDGSPDNVADVVRPYVRKDSRIRFLHTENFGLSGARNNAIRESKGEYILPLDADDMIHKDYIRLAIRRFQDYPETRLVYCKWKFFGSNSNTPRIEYHGYEELLKGNSIFCSALYRRSDFDRVGGYDEDFKSGYEDWEFWIRLLDDDAAVYQIPRPLFLYRQKPGSMAPTKATQEKLDRCYDQIYRKHIDLYRSRFGTPLGVLNEYGYLRRRVNKWRSRNIFVRIFFAIKGRL